MEEVRSKKQALRTTSIVGLVAQGRVPINKEKIMTKDRKTNTRLSQLQAAQVIVKINDLYDKENGCWPVGVSDESISQMFTFPCAETSVANLRKQIFGNFKVRGGHGKFTLQPLLELFESQQKANHAEGVRLKNISRKTSERYFAQAEGQAWCISQLKAFMEKL